jgi:hypothetical protein
MEIRTLSERIVALRAEAEALLEAKAAQLAEESPGVPVGVLRNLIAARAPGCSCLQVLRHNTDD